MQSHSDMQLVPEMPMLLIHPPLGTPLDTQCNEVSFFVLAAGAECTARRLQQPAAAAAATRRSGHRPACGRSYCALPGEALTRFVKLLAQEWHVLNGCVYALSAGYRHHRCRCCMTSAVNRFFWTADWLLLLAHAVGKQH